MIKPRERKIKNFKLPNITKLKIKLIIQVQNSIVREIKY